MADSEAHAGPGSVPRRRGPAPAFTVEEIARAGVGVADAHGLDAVTMRSVAGALGITASALYRYVDSREDLLVQMVDLVSAELDHPAPSGDWLADLTLVATGQRDLHRGHRWLGEASTLAPTMGPHVLDHLDWGLAALASVEASTQAKLTAIALANGLAVLFASAGAAPAPDAFARLDAARHPRLAAQFVQPNPDSAPEDIFERVLAAVLRETLDPA